MAAQTTSPNSPAATALATRDDRYDGLAMVTSPAEALRRYQELQAFCKEVFVSGVDYGVIPGTQKPSLYQPGAQKLCELYGFAHAFEATTTVEDWDKPFFFYRKRCVITTRRDARFVGEGIGSCNSREDRYAGRWVFDNDVPRGVDVKTLKRKEGEKNGRAWVMYKMPNEDLFSLVNTIEKMACKRALVGAVLAVTRMSGMFGQDVEDIPREWLGVVDEVRPWERREDDGPTDLDDVAKGFEHAIAQLVLKGGTADQLKAIGLAVEESPLDDSRKVRIREAYARALAQIGKGRVERKTQGVADRVNQRNQRAQNAPPPSEPRGTGRSSQPTDGSDYDEHSAEYPPEGT